MLDGMRSVGENERLGVAIVRSVANSKDKCSVYRNVAFGKRGTVGEMPAGIEQALKLLWNASFNLNFSFYRLDCVREFS